MVGWHHQLKGHEFEQTREMMNDRETWHATVHGSQRVQHEQMSEQQQI